MKAPLALTCCVLFALGNLCAQTSLEEWWQGKHGTGEWLGVRPTLEDHGVNLSGKWVGTFYGVVSGGEERRGAFDQSLHFDIKVDVAKLTGWEALEGLSAVAGV